MDGSLQSNDGCKWLKLLNNLVWQRDHTKVERKIVSTLAENGLAMAGPARPVPAPMPRAE